MLCGTRRLSARGCGARRLGAGKLDDVECGQFAVGIADQQVEVAQAKTVWQPGHRARVPHGPVSALALQHDGPGCCGLLSGQDRRKLGHAALAGDRAGLCERFGRAGAVGTGSPGR